MSDLADTCDEIERVLAYAPEQLIGCLDNAEHAAVVHWAGRLRALIRLGELQNEHRLLDSYADIPRFEALCNLVNGALVDCDEEMPAPAPPFERPAVWGPPEED